MTSSAITSPAPAASGPSSLITSPPTPNKSVAKAKLTFHDLEVLLAGSSDAPRPLLAQGPSEESRLRIDYRLDAKFEHWLLDEFQDTSYMQWSIIENLVDEAVQDLSGERSLFQVGDIKQAIYAWRGGDTQLFGDIAKRYQGEDERALKMRDLSVSWRSGEDVIQPLNQIFGNKDALAELGLPKRALEQWHWTPHQVAGTQSKASRPHRLLPTRSRRWRKGHQRGLLRPRPRYP